MIPRYKPTYSYGDLWRSFRDSFSGESAIQLEASLKKFFGCKYVFLLEDGKTAITIILKSLGQSGEILTPAYNCIAVPQAICRAGYKPRFVDAPPGRLNVSPSDMLDAMTPGIKAVIPIHLFGIPWEMDEFYSMYKERAVPVIEDAAPAFGARRHGRLLGGSSDAIILSFHWTKPVSGESGGAILTSNDDLGKKIAEYMGNVSSTQKRLSLFVKSWWRKSVTQRMTYGLTRVGHSILYGEKMFEVVKPEKCQSGDKFRSISPFSAALVLRQLGRLEQNMESRRATAKIYQEELAGNDQFILPYVPEGSEPSWIQYPLLVKNKEAFFRHMQKSGVDITWSYRYSCPDTYDMDGFNNSHKIAHEIVSLPAWPGIDPEEAKKIGKIAVEFRE